MSYYNIEQVVPDQGCILYHDYTPNFEALGVINWINQSQSSIAITTSPPRSSVNADYFVIMEEYEVFIYDYSGELKKSLVAPDGTSFSCIDNLLKSSHYAAHLVLGLSTSTNSQLALINLEAFILQQ